MAHTFTSTNLDALVAIARHIVMTPAQLAAQRRSFAYGNVVIENPRVTREMIAEADKAIA